MFSDRLAGKIVIMNQRKLRDFDQMEVKESVTDPVKADDIFSYISKNLEMRRRNKKKKF